MGRKKLLRERKRPNIPIGRFQSSIIKNLYPPHTGNRETESGNIIRHR